MYFDPLSDKLNSMQEFINLKNASQFMFDLKYTHPDNFLGHNLYADFKGCFLHQIAANRLQVALKLLQQQHPQATFLIYDCLRPRSAQRLMWSKVVNTPQQKYIADPEKGSMHNYGLAVDLTICNLGNGAVWDMGTDFDHFSPLAEPELDQQHLEKGALSNDQVENRKVLYQVMNQAGFLGIKHEWWHYNATSYEEAKNKYFLIE